MHSLHSNRDEVPISIVLYSNSFKEGDWRMGFNIVVEFNLPLNIRWFCRNISKIESNFG